MRAKRVLCHALTFIFNIFKIKTEWKRMSTAEENKRLKKELVDFQLIQQKREEKLKAIIAQLQKGVKSGTYEADMARLNKELADALRQKQEAEAKLAKLQAAATPEPSAQPAKYEWGKVASEDYVCRVKTCEPGFHRFVTSNGQACCIVPYYKGTQEDPA